MFSATCPVGSEAFSFVNASGEADSAFDFGKAEIEEESTTSPSLFSLAWTTLASSAAAVGIIGEALSVSAVFSKVGVSAYTVTVFWG
ncbi:hypothetical protein [Streptococcus suis]|uniref:hypothetical protein n=1 Tax=Streptococcus suis TaxID=1307 RepID=UPI001EE756B1|nr:hypothetical protein [Streptococcus suis]